MFLGIFSRDNRIILGNDRQWFLSNLPCLSFNHHIIEATIVGGIILPQWPMMACDGSELVSCLIILIVLFKVVYECFYLKVHCPFEWSPLSETQKPEIQQSHMYSLIHWFTHPRIHRGDHFLVIFCTYMLLPE